MKRFAIPAGRSIGGRTIDAHVKVVSVRVPVGGLHHDLLGTRDRRPRSAPSPCRREQSAFQCVGNEDVLNACIGIGHQAREELPITRVVEPQRFVGSQASPVAIEGRKSKRVEGAIVRTDHVERNVDIASVLV
jgi:hypothetical protein